MSQFAKVKKPVFVFSLLAMALIVEFILLEGIVGVSLPQDRNSAVSSLEIKTKGTSLHFITRNKRFIVVDLVTANGSRLSWRWSCANLSCGDRKDSLRVPRMLPLLSRRWQPGRT